MKRVIFAISAITRQDIVPGKTLIILDEIQELSRGLSTLKYFCENAPEYHVAVAGSLLGIAMHRRQSFPVGKVDILHISFAQEPICQGTERILFHIECDEHSHRTLRPCHAICNLKKTMIFDEYGAR